LFLGGYNLDYSIISSLAVFIYNAYDFVLDYLEPIYINTKYAFNDAYNYILNNTSEGLSPLESSKSGIIDINAFKQYQSDLVKHNVDTYFENLLSNPKIENIAYALIIGLKTAIMIFVFI